MDDSTGPTLPGRSLHRRIRHAMRILENEQKPLAATADVAASDTTASCFVIPDV